MHAQVAKWQTRTVQVRVPERACGFKSHLAHRGRFYDVLVELALLGAAAVVLVVAAAGFSRKLGVASPLILVAVGAGMSYLPGAPEIPIEPEWILILVLPPLLYSAAVNVPLMDFRRNMTPIVGLGVLAVIISAFAIGFLLFVLTPDLDFAAALALGAVVSPTDAVAATSIAKRLGLPHRLVTVLEGESLINDASALVLLKTAIAAIGGTVSLGGAIGQFGLAVVVGVAVGLVLGAASVWVRARFTDDLLGTALSFIVPFLAYIGAERFGGSGVIGVVVAGLLIGHQSARRFSARTRVSERMNWRTIQFVLENGVFLLMGYQLHVYVADVHEQYGNDGLIWTFGVGLLLVIALIVVRAIFVAPMLGWMRLQDRRRLAAGERMREAEDAIRERARGSRGEERIDRMLRRRGADLEFLRREGLGWRGGTVLASAGMRGVVTVAAAQALPASVPFRSELILMAFVVAVVTLAVGGLTLPVIIRALGLRPADEEALAAERTELLDELMGVTLEALRNPALGEDDEHIEEAVLEIVRRENAELGRSVQERFAAVGDPEHEQLRRLRAFVLEAQRGALLDARSSGAYSSATINAIQAVLDQAEMRITRGDTH